MGPTDETAARRDEPPRHRLQGPRLHGPRLHGPRTRRPRLHGRWRLAGLAGLALLVAVLGAALWVGARAYLAVGELQGAVPIASALEAGIQSSDETRAQSLAHELAGHTGNAAALTSDVVWRAAEFVPWLGANLTAVRQLAAATDIATQKALVPLADLTGTMSLGSLKPVNAKIALEPLVAAQPALASASAALATSSADVESIDAGQVIGPIADAKIRLQKLLDQALTGVDALDRTARLMPAMLGADGPRDYLLLLQNSAELRSTGGISGAMALLHTDNGAFSLTQQASTSDFPTFAESVLPLPTDTRALYGENTGRYLQDINFTPRFELSGQLAREMWRQRFGVAPDGVIAVDPVVLSYVLAATGPVTLASGDTLTSENATTILLKDVYERYPGQDGQNAFFADTTLKVFQALSRETVDPLALVKALARAGTEHRLLIWSSHADDQQILAGTILTGALPVTTADVQRFGVYFNDTTGGKMAPYLDIRMAAGQMVCRNDGLPNYEVQVTLANTVPVGAVLPDYTTGGGWYGVAPGSIQTGVAVYGTVGSYNLGVLRDGGPTAYQPTADGDYTLSTVSILLKPGESTVLIFRFLGGDSRPRTVELQSTPLASAAGPATHEVSCGTGGG
jgi:hypothetical protein